MGFLDGLPQGWMAASLAFLCLAVSAIAETYNARVVGKQILTPCPGQVPEIDGTEV
jgi:hypothetical protein